MSDPVRLVEEGDALEMRVLEAGRGERAPTALRGRVLAAGIVGAGVATGSGAGAGLKGAGAGLGAGVKGVGALAAAKWAGIALMAAVATAGVASVVAPSRVERVPVKVSVIAAPTSANRATPPPAPNPSPAPAPEPASSVPSTSPIPPRPIPNLPLSPPPLPSPPSLSASASPSPTSDLAKELALLDTARVALDSGDTTLAIHQLDRHDLDYLHGQLAPDALALRIEVYARRGDDSKVRELSRAFLGQYPDHPQAPRVRRLSSSGANP